MKKTYIKPEMDMETIELETMIAGSDLGYTQDSATNSIDDDRMMGKDRNNDWSGLLW